MAIGRCHRAACIQKRCVKATRLKASFKACRIYGRAALDCEAPTAGAQGNPMAMLVENAGGLAVSGTTPVLELQPTDIHERCPVFLGSRTDVQRILDLHRKHGVE